MNQETGDADAVDPLKSKDHAFDSDSQENDPHSPFHVASEGEFEFSQTLANGRRSVLTITLLFYLVTSGAILSACLRSLVGRVELTDASFVGVLIGGSAIGLFASMISGYFYFRSVTAAVVSGGAGIFVGAIAGGLALVGSDAFVEVAIIAFGGCWLMLMVMLLTARLQSPVHSNLS